MRLAFRTRASRVRIGHFYKMAKEHLWFAYNVALCLISLLYALLPIFGPVQISSYWQGACRAVPPERGRTPKRD